MIALFVASAAIGALSSIAAVSSTSGGSAGKDTLAELFCSFSTTNCPASAQVPSVSSQVLAELRATPGVRAVTVVHQSPSRTAHSEVRSGTRSGSLRATSWRRPPPSASALRARRWQVSAISSRISSVTTRTRHRRSGPPQTCQRRAPRVFPLMRSSSQRPGRRVPLNEYGPRSNGSFPSREHRSKSRRPIRRTRDSSQ